MSSFKKLTLMMMMSVLLVVMFLLPSSQATECPVCLKVLQRVNEQLSAAEKKDQQAIEAKIQAVCDSATDRKEIRLCYYIDTVKREISKPLQEGLPLERICDRLGQKDGSICALQYAADLSTIDPTTLRVKEIKKLLAENGVECKGCLEKPDYIAKLKELIAKKTGKQEL